MRELRWTEAEKKLSRRAFEVALLAELADVLQDFKARAPALQTPDDMWPIEHFLRQRGRELDAKYDYRYSQLISVFGGRVREGRLTEGHLEVCLTTNWSSSDGLRRFDSPDSAAANVAVPQAIDRWWAVLGSNQWPLPCETGV